MKMIDCENARSERARKVVKPPLKTGGPILCIAKSDFSNLVPKRVNFVLK